MFLEALVTSPLTSFSRRVTHGVRCWRGWGRGKDENEFVVHSRWDLKFSAMSGIGLCFGRVNDGTCLGSRLESVL